jgi:hypothetical protein
MAIFVALLWLSVLLDEARCMYKKFKWVILPTALVLVSVAIVLASDTSETALPEITSNPPITVCAKAQFHPSASAVEKALKAAIRESYYSTTYASDKDLCVFCVWISWSFAAFFPPYDIACYRDPVVQVLETRDTCPDLIEVCHNQTLCEKFRGLGACVMYKASKWTF